MFNGSFTSKRITGQSSAALLWLRDLVLVWKETRADVVVEHDQGTRMTVYEQWQRICMETDRSIECDTVSYFISLYVSVVISNPID